PAVLYTLSLHDALPILGGEGLPLDRDLLPLLVDVELACADDAAATPTAGDDRRMAGGAAGAGENADGAMHAGDVLGAGFLAAERSEERRVGEECSAGRW